MASQPISIRQLPIIGKQVSTIGQIVDLMAMPCNPSPMIIATAFFHAAPKFVWSIVKPDPVDYLTTRFGSHHKQRRQRWMKAVAVDDPDWPPARNKLGTISLSGVKLLERIGWYFLIVDATEDFLINWMSTAYIWDGCDGAADSYCNCVGLNNTFVQPPGIYSPMAMWQVTSQRGFVGGSTTVETDQDEEVTAFANINYTSGPFPDNTRMHATFQLIDFFDGVKVLDEADAEQRGEGIYGASFSYKDWRLQHPAMSLGFRMIQHSGSTANFTDSSFRVYGKAQKGISPDP